MADVKWIKITTDIFDDEKMLMIEDSPMADSIITIWFKLLVFAGKKNNDGVFIFRDNIPYTDEMLSKIFKRDIQIVRLAIATFEQLGMIDIIDDVITIPNWGKHQTLDSYEKKKIRDREYQTERRQRQKQLVNDLQKNRLMSDDSSLDVGFSEEEIDKEKDIIINNNNIYSAERAEIIDYLNQRLGTRYRKNSKEIKRHVDARLKEGFTVDDFRTVIDKKYADWYGTDMEQYLRPQTLFGTKFESYLNTVSKNTRYQTNLATDMNDLDDLF